MRTSCQNGHLYVHRGVCFNCGRFDWDALRKWEQRHRNDALAFRRSSEPINPKAIT